MRLPFFLIPALVATLGACSEFPELEGTVDSAARDARYPDLVPIKTIKSGVADTQIEPETQEDLETRVERLQRRAGRLKGAVVDQATQERMQTGVEPVTQ